MLIRVLEDAIDVVDSYVKSVVDTLPATAQVPSQAASGTTDGETVASIEAELIRDVADRTLSKAQRINKKRWLNKRLA